MPALSGLGMSSAPGVERTVSSTKTRAAGVRELSTTMQRGQAVRMARRRSGQAGSGSNVTVTAGGGEALRSWRGPVKVGDDFCHEGEAGGFLDGGIEMSDGSAVYATALPVFDEGVDGFAVWR